jgi:uncharacterized protein (DUF2062 family)
MWAAHLESWMRRLECTDMLEAMASVWQRWGVQPVTGLLRHGAEPKKLAWSLALGMVVGVNPLLGSTTLLALGLASVFRLNLVASQVGNHAMYPLEIALFPVFVKLGSLVFSTAKLPLHGKALWEAVKAHPWDTTRVLWTWEWHALVVWVAFAAVAMPAIALGIRPVLEKMQRRMGRKSEVIGSTQPSRRTG